MDWCAGINYDRDQPNNTNSWFAAQQLKIAKTVWLKCLQTKKFSFHLCWTRPWRLSLVLLMADWLNELKWLLLFSQHLPLWTEYQARTGSGQILRPNYRNSLVFTTLIKQSRELLFYWRCTAVTQNSSSDGKLQERRCVQRDPGGPEAQHQVFGERDRAVVRKLQETVSDGTHQQRRVSVHLQQVLPGQRGRHVRPTCLPLLRHKRRRHAGFQGVHHRPPPDVNREDHQQTGVGLLSVRRGQERIHHQVRGHRDLHGESRGQRWRTP